MVLMQYFFFLSFFIKAYVVVEAIQMSTNNTNKEVDKSSLAVF